MATDSVVEAEGAARRRELSRLLAAAAGADERPARLVLVTGPRGAGKTRLLEALRRQHVLGGGLALEAWCAPFPPFETVAQVVGGAVRWLRQVGADFEPPAGLRCRHGCHRLWYEHEGVVDDHHETGDILSRERFLTDAVEPLAAVGRLRAPMVLLHDLDRADPGTLEWLKRLLEARPPWAERASSAAVLVVASAATQDGLESVLEPLERQQRLEHVPLGPLDLEGVRALLASPRIAARVLQRTGGHVEAIERLVGAELPTAEAAWSARFERLPVDHRRLLGALAVLGRPATERELSDWLGREVAELLDRLTADEWVERVDDGARVRFARESLRERVHDEFDDAWRQGAAGRWSEVLSAQPGALPEAVHLALDAGRLEDALRNAPAAAETLVARHADREAVELLVRVAHRCRPAPPVDLLRRIVDLATEAAVPEPAIPLAEAALEADPEPELALRIGVLLRVADRLEAARRALHRATAEDAPEAVRLEATAELAVVALEDDRLEEAERFAKDVLSACCEEHLDVMLSARNTLGRVALTRGDRQAAARAFHANLETAREAGRGRHVARACINLAVLAIQEHRYEEATRLLRKAQDEARTSGAPKLEALALANLAIVTTRRRHFAEALSLFRETLERLRAMGLRMFLARISVSLGELYEALGAHHRAQALAQFAAQVGGTQWTPSARVEHLLLEGRCALSLGEATRAAATFETAWKLAAEQDAPRKFDIVVGLVRAALQAGRLADALTWFNRLPDAASAGKLAERTLLQVDLARARHGSEGALRAAERAVETVARADDPLRSFQAWLALAEVRLDAGQVDRAQEAYGRALSLEQSLSERVPEEFAESWAHRPLRRRMEALAARLAERSRGRDPLPPPHVEASGPRDRSAELQRRFPALVGTSPALLEVLDRIDRVAGTDVLVLVRGESGTGKELVAEAIHGASHRARGPLVKVNCAALVETLLLSELFGHEKGAFTGATSRRRGRFELADGGTLFLDEIGDIAPKTQVALLRVLQERVFERVGGTQPISVDVRIVAATNRDLEQLVADGRFREDLYYRLRCVTIEMPPLRERREDIPLLAGHLLRRIAEEHGIPRRRLTAEAAAALQRHDWPGNVRELENVLRSVALFSDRALLRASDVTPFLQDRRRQPTPSVAPAPSPNGPVAAGTTEAATQDASVAVTEAAAPAGAGTPDGPVDLESALYERVRDSDRSWLEWKKELERACVAHALKEAGGNITQAARLLGMKRPRLSQLVKEYGLGSLKREVRT